MKRELYESGALATGARPLVRVSRSMFRIGELVTEL